MGHPRNPTTATIPDFSILNNFNNLVKSGVKFLITVATFPKTFTIFSTAPITFPMIINTGPNTATTVETTAIIF